MGDPGAPSTLQKRQTQSDSTVIVVDASVLAIALIDDGQSGYTVRRDLSTHALAAPHLVDLEFVYVVRRLVASGRLGSERAGQAIQDLTDLPIRRCDHVPLVQRCWELRNNVTAYDAAYVALAEALDVPLWTADARLAAAPGVSCAVTLVR